MRWVLVATAAVLGAVVTWFLTARRDADGPEGGADHVDHAADGDPASGFGGTPTPPSAVVGPAEGWMRDAEDEDALLARSEAPVAPADGKGSDADVGVDPPMNVPPVPSATPSGDVAGVGEPETVAAVEAESEAKAPTPADEAAEDPHARD